ncbi:hypothetical protein [Desulfoferrobacter suflitae]|uniref:hypothetical protein n=1 Tax=Desulfoferrobacter suflitae TaxID=2865782 RepID=UPI0021649D26|nr:hypothetical protein [Desulfoferrobacter suflitae]MCK8601239.1 hypothetical protein [Desulfoferrobacter suflitae]
MKVIWMVGLLLVPLFLTPPALAQSKVSMDLTEEEFDLFYGLFKDIQSFGLISLALVGDAERIGLSEQSLTRFLDEKFTEHFCNIRYQDLSQDASRLAEAIALRDKKIGLITFRVWVIGEDYPMAYHVRCDAGSFQNPNIWSEEVLGHGSSRTVPTAIREILDELLQQFARVFLKARGERCNP